LFQLEAGVADRFMMRVCTDGDADEADIHAEMAYFAKIRFRTH
jgi:hypothetical protein